MKVDEKYYKATESLLYNYQMYKISISNIEKEIEYLEEEDGSKALSYDGISTSPTNKISSMTEETALAVVEKIEYLERIIERNTRKVESIDRALEGLTWIERVVIEQKYILGKQWWQVGAEACFSERHCKRIRTDAIRKMVVGIYGETKGVE